MLIFMIADKNKYVLEMTMNLCRVVCVNRSSVWSRKSFFWGRKKGWNFFSFYSFLFSIPFDIARNKACRWDGNRRVIKGF